jgi:hypothetical protein
MSTTWGAWAAPLTSPSVAADRATWIDRYARALGVTPPSEDEIEALLALAGVAAHASERTAAPLSCWLAAVAGVPAREALRAAEDLSAELTGPT